MARNNYSCLSDREEKLRNGYLIVGDTLFEVQNSTINDSWELTGNTIEEKVESARKEAELSSRIKIYYDDEELYSENVLHDEGRLITVYDVELTEDEEALIEHYN